jgi:putative photosynthetic complex assembly protein
MSHVHHDPTVPKQALIAAAVLLSVTMALTGAVSMGWIAKSAVPEAGRAASGVAPEVTRLLTVADRADGAVIISDAASGQMVMEIGYGQGGFVRATLRRLAKARAAAGIGSEPPFELVRWANGALSLRDPQTGKTAEIHGFGPDHSRTFAEMLKGPAA